MTADSREPERTPRRTRTYLLVLLVETLVITALWTFGHYFGSQ